MDLLGRLTATDACPHLPETPAEAQADRRQECGSGLNLRLCATCGHVGCCESQAGTGLRRAGLALVGTGVPVHLLLTHLHMDHIQGLGFFRPLFEPGREIHVWGPPSTTLDLRSRLTRYLSPPLFPVRISDLDSRVELHDAPTSPWRIGAFTVTAATVVHPGPTLGYRVALNGAAMAYLPDDEPALAGLDGDPAWTSGYDLAAGVDLLVHDGQYTAAEYAHRVDLQRRPRAGRVTRRTAGRSR